MNDFVIGHFLSIRTASENLAGEREKEFRGLEAPRYGPDFGSGESGLLRSRAVFVFLVEAGVAILEADFLAGDPHSLHVGADIENVSVGGEQRGFFSDFDGAEAVGHAVKPSVVSPK